MLCTHRLDWVMTIECVLLDFCVFFMRVCVWCGVCVCVCMCVCVWCVLRAHRLDGVMTITTEHDHLCLWCDLVTTSVVKSYFRSKELL